ncbi:aldolase/citrate lyase family protein [Xanthobacteraceae bacterium Astr-EGSB]|uniref:HpcH/HpaI aldolase family protein n=1 Tax=Astrobacterium formosum TaxID=3069710 RepID=UPI0027B170EE|nr:aldolase/citrate lyase family protein [Xanthobacteraceae bacterium Astr-EGSB]
MIVENAVLRRLRGGAIAASFNVSRLRTVEVSQIARACGFHWLFIDLEHSTADLDLASQLCLAALPTGVTPIVRVPEGDVNMATRILDGGAQGIIFPHVDSAAEAERLVRACRYPVRGTRSLTFPGAQLGYQAMKAGEAMKLLDGETLIVAMVETPEAVKNTREIAAVEGIDVVMIGGQDLCSTMGIPGQTSHPMFVEAVGKVVDDTRAAGKWPGLGGVYDESLLKTFIERGVLFFLGGADFAFLMAGARARGAFFKTFDKDPA